jgi:hypothetical protein
MCIQVKTCWLTPMSLAACEPAKLATIKANDAGKVWSKNARVAGRLQRIVSRIFTPTSTFTRFNS